MPKTTVSDIISSPRFLQYYREETIKRNALIASGVVIEDPRIAGMAGSKGAATVSLPFWNTLSGSDEVLSDSASLTETALTAGKQIAAILARGKAITVDELADIRSGADPAQAIAQGWAEFWATREQVALIAILTGILADNDANDGDDLLLKIYSDAADPAAATQLTGSTFVDAKKKLGDAARNIVATAMHSDVYHHLQKLELISTVRPSADVEFETFQGRRVIVDDDCPTAAGANSTQYTTYLLGAGAIARDAGWPGPDPAFESDRDILAGDTVMTSRQQFLLHPNGFKFTSASVAGDTPTNAELEAAANWDRVLDRKRCAIVGVQHNIAV